MFKGFNSINSGFKKGFDLVYHSKVHCPVCKEIIYANALMCPNCKTNFQKPPYNKTKEWQKIPLRITLFVSIFIGLAVCSSNAPVILGLIIGLIVYGIGYVLIHKIQSFKNYHKRK